MTDQPSFSIGEASDKTGLPKSTIRYYEKEFSDYLAIERGENNQRIFTEENLKDLEYIRFLIKREEMSMDEVANRLEREMDLKDRYKNNSDQADISEGQKDSPDADLKGTVEDLKTEIHELRTLIQDQEATIEQVREDQENVLKLLDMNLQRYNKLVENLPT